MPTNRHTALTLLPLLLIALAAARPHPAAAQGPPFNLPPTLVGSQSLTAATWNFDGDIDALGPWGTLAVTNTECGFLVQPGTAQAGAFFFQGTLQEIATVSGGAVYVGDVGGFGGVTGHARVTISPGPTVTTHADVTLWNVPSTLFGTTFNVCLGPPPAGSTAALIAANAAAVVRMGYQVTGVATTQGPGGGTFMAISGSMGPGVQFPFWVFFFIGSRYLGTDTATPSLQLQLTGSPAPGQINVQYVGYGDPATITYTWNGSTVTPSGTPPGH